MVVDGAKPPLRRSCTSSIAELAMTAGAEVGNSVGATVGALVGAFVGEAVGGAVGGSVGGGSVGALVGKVQFDPVGHTEPAGQL